MPLFVRFDHRYDDYDVDYVVVVDDDVGGLLTLIMPLFVPFSHHGHDAKDSDGHDHGAKD